MTQRSNARRGQLLLLGTILAAGLATSAHADAPGTSQRFIEKMHKDQADAIERNRNAWTRQQTKGRTATGRAAVPVRRDRRSNRQRMRSVVDRHAAYMRAHCDAYQAISPAYFAGKSKAAMRSFMTRQSPPRHAGSWAGKGLRLQINIFEADCKFYAKRPSKSRGRLPPIRGTCHPLNLDACDGRCKRGYGPGCKVWKRYANKRASLSAQAYKALIMKEIGEGRVGLMVRPAYTAAQKHQHLYARALNLCRAKRVVGCTRLVTLLAGDGRMREARLAGDYGCALARQQKRPNAVRTACSMARKVGSRSTKAPKIGRSAALVRDRLRKRTLSDADLKAALKRCLTKRHQWVACNKVITHHEELGDYRSASRLAAYQCIVTNRVMRTLGPCRKAVDLRVADRVTATREGWGKPNSFHLKECELGERAGCYRALRVLTAKGNYAQAIRAAKMACLRAIENGEGELRSCGLYGQLVSPAPIPTFGVVKDPTPVCFGAKACKLAKRAASKRRKSHWKEVQMDLKRFKRPVSGRAKRKNKLLTWNEQFYDLRLCGTASLPKERRVRDRACARFLSVYGAP